MKLRKESAELLVATALTWVVSLVYLVLPVDLVPDFIPLLGQVDDLLALLAAVGLSLHTWHQLRAVPVVDQLPDGMELLREDDPTAYGWEAYQPLSVEEVRGL